MTEHIDADKAVDYLAADTTEISTGSGLVYTTSTGAATWIPSTVTGTTMSVSKPPTPSKILDAPRKLPRKVLVAFLDENDEVEWCAKVRPTEVNVDYDVVTMTPQLSLRAHLIQAD